MRYLYTYRPDGTVLDVAQFPDELQEVTSEPQLTRKQQWVAKEVRRQAKAHKMPALVADLKPKKDGPTLHHEVQAKGPLETLQKRDIGKRPRFGGPNPRGADAAPRRKVVKKKAKVAKKAAPKPDTGTTISASDIATEVGVASTALRKALRASDMTKPEGGWSWSPKHRDVKKVRAMALELVS